MPRRGRSVRGVRVRGVRRVRERAGGPVRWKYHRATGLPLPADIPEDHPNFLAAYAAAEAHQTTPQARSHKTGSLGRTIRDLRTSSAWTGLSAGYRRQMTIEAERLTTKAGHVPLAQLLEKHVRTDLREVEGHAAVRRLKFWRLLFRFAEDMADPTQGIRKPKTAAAKQREPWMPDEVAAFRAHWPLDTKQRLAFELMQWTGARVNDAFRLGPGMVDRDGWLVFTQSKTGGEVSIPFRRDVPPFAEREGLEQLHAAILAQPDRHMIWLATRAGHARSEKSASMWFSRACRDAGIEGKTAHGLRVSRAIDLAERGATTHQIGAWTGHKSLDEIEHYSQRADKRRLLSGTHEERPSVQKM